MYNGYLKTLLAMPHAMVAMHTHTQPGYINQAKGVPMTSAILAIKNWFPKVLLHEHGF